jgi:flavin-dependent dehydrogenase
MTMRSRFDGLLTERAVEAGCTVRDEITVRGLTREGGAWRLDTSRGAVEADFVVGADGANSVVGRATGLQRGLAESVAYEAEVRAPSRVHDAWRHTVGIDLGYRPSGYAWIFPKADVLSAGLVLPKSEGATLRQQFEDFRGRSGLAGAPVEIESGHKVLFRREVTPLSLCGALLAGDAAGLADELSEEGIYYAVRSGQLAARAILRSTDGGLGAYDATVNREIQPELDAARAIADWVYRMIVRWPAGVMFASRAIGYLWEAAFRVQRGESDYAVELDQLPGVVRRLGARVAR